MKPFASAALCLTLTLSSSAQAPQFSDPANLRGERPRPRDGRELPIDGGLGADGHANTALALQQLLRKLNTRASLLNIVAHPDDEDGGMLTFYSRGLGARVADLSLTRGEGGQNAVTADFEDALGLLRTQELLASDRYSGVDQFFGTEVDFGFSKTKSEAFAKWTHDRVLYDTVRAIRLYRPLVLTSTWIGGVTDGHGQHQASGQIAQEAFLAAGDPKVFPGMIAEGILPWQPLRIYARVPTQSISAKGLFDYATNQYVPAEFTNYVTGITSTTPPSTDILVHEGQPDPLLTPAAANPADLEQLATGNWQPATGSSKLAAGSSQPAAGSPKSTTAQATTPFTYVQFARIGLGLQRSQIPANFRIPPAGTFDVPYHLYGSCPTPDFKTCHLERSEGTASQAPSARNITAQAAGLGQASQATQRAESPTQDAAPTTAPTFFTGIDTSIAGIASLAPSATGPIALTIKTNLAGIQHSIDEAQLDFKPDHPELPANHLAEALKLTDMTLHNIEGFTTTQLPRTEQANLLHELRIKRVQLNDALTLALGHSFPTPCGTTSVVPRPYFFRTSIEQPVYQLTNPELRNAPATPSTSCPVTPSTASSTTYRLIGYGDLPRTVYYPPPPKHVSLVDIKLPTHHHLAYLPGTGDAVPEALASIALTPTLLTVADLTPTTLAQYDTVILGVRTYAAHPDLHGAPTQALLNYASSGGNVLVQYQTAEFTAADAPYPLTLGPSAEKVVDETDPVVFLGQGTNGYPEPSGSGLIAKEEKEALAPGYALLSRPNRLTPADFNNWVEERGHGFLRTWDPRYTALTEVHDPGAPSEHILPQEPQRGGLITTQLGSGRWTYLAFAVYRQLPEAVPGAFRLFVNLLQK